MAINEKPADTDDIWFTATPEPKPRAPKPATPPSIASRFGFVTSAAPRKSSDIDKVVDTFRCSGQI